MVQMKIQLLKEARPHDAKPRKAEKFQAANHQDPHDALRDYINLLINEDEATFNPNISYEVRQKWGTFYSVLESFSCELGPIHSTEDYLFVTIINPDEHNLHNVAPRMGDALLDFALSFSE